MASRAEDAGGSAPAEAPESPSSAGLADDLEILLDAGVLYARERLSHSEELYPYAFVMNPRGDLQRLKLGKGAKPEAEDGLTVMREGLKRQAREGQLRAVAVFADVLVALRGHGETDALQVFVDHRDGVCWTLYFPYWRTPDRQLVLQEPVSVRRKTGMFANCGAALAPPG